MLENCDRTLTRELGDDALFFEFGPFNETLGFVPVEGGGGADGDNGMGLTLRATRRTRTNFSETAIRATW